MFVRMPWDEVRKVGDSNTDSVEVFNMMAKTYLTSHPVMKKNHSPCAGTRIDGKKVKKDAFPTGMVHGADLEPSMFTGSMLDYVWDKYNIPMISAHISCCNYPRPRNLLEPNKEGMFMTIYPEGKHKLELVHNNFQTKIMQFTVEKSRMTRRDVIMDSLAPSLSYHTIE